MKKLFALLLVFTMIFGTLSTNAFAAGSSRGSFSGSHSISSGSHFGGSTYSSGKTYSSGVKRPSSNVTPSNRTSSYGNSSYGSPQYQQPRSSGLGHFLGGMAAGAIASSLFSHMFHPFGGYYGMGGGYGYHGFSLWSVILDLVILYIVFRIVRRIFSRR